jgi:hypothetical protein
VTGQSGLFFNANISMLCYIIGSMAQMREAVTAALALLKNCTCSKNTRRTEKVIDITTKKTLYFLTKTSQLISNKYILFTLPSFSFINFYEKRFLKLSLHTSFCSAFNAVSS